jgi:hypothetical protein
MLVTLAFDFGMVVAMEDSSSGADLPYYASLTFPRGLGICNHLAGCA